MTRRKTVQRRVLPAILLALVGLCVSCSSTSPTSTNATTCTVVFENHTGARLHFYMNTIFMDFLDAGVTYPVEDNPPGTYQLTVAYREPEQCDPFTTLATNTCQFVKDTVVTLPAGGSFTWAIFNL